MTACALRDLDLPRSEMPDRIKVEVHRRIPGLREADPPVFLNPDLPSWGYTSFAHFGEHRIEVRPMEDEGMMDLVLAHEYVHAALRPEWDVLPDCVEEGLATRVGEWVSPYHGRQVRSMVSNALAVALFGEPSPALLPLEWADLTPEEIETYPRNQQGAVWGMGLVIAYEISPDDLFQLVQRAKRDERAIVPADWLLAMVGPRLIGREPTPETLRQDCFEILRTWIRKNPPIPPEAHGKPAQAESADHR